MQPQPDFAAMIAGLESHGISRKEIAQRAGVSRATVWRLANDTNRDHLSGTVAKIERISRSIKNSRVKQK